MYSYTKPFRDLIWDFLEATVNNLKKEMKDLSLLPFHFQQRGIQKGVKSVQKKLDKLYKDIQHIKNLRPNLNIDKDSEAKWENILQSYYPQVRFESMEDVTRRLMRHPIACSLKLFDIDRIMNSLEKELLSCNGDIPREYLTCIEIKQRLKEKLKEKRQEILEETFSEKRRKKILEEIIEKFRKERQEILEETFNQEVRYGMIENIIEGIIERFKEEGK